MWKQSQTGLNIPLPPARAEGRELPARHSREHWSHDNQSPASGQVLGGQGVWREGWLQGGELVWESRE